MAKEFNYTWIWDLKSAPEDLWPLVSDTNRFNRDTGLPPMTLLETSKGVKRIKFNIPFVNVEWEEEPFEWNYPHHFGILRRYKTSLFKEMRVDCNLERTENSGTRLIYKVRAQARNLLGDIAIPLGIGIMSAKRFGAAMKKYDRIVLNGNQILGTQSGAQLSSFNRKYLQNKIAQLKEQNIDGVILDFLAEFLGRADGISAQQMRPYALADGWGTPRRATLEVFLRATRVGILDMYWDILCPECRGVTDDFSNLHELHSASHCGACEMDFHANFDENIEVIFRPNESIRKVDTKVQFCVGTSPQRQPKFILNNLIVPAHEQMSVGVTLAAGRYNVFTAELDGMKILSASEQGADKAEIHAHENGLSGTLSVGLYPHLILNNETGHDQNFEIVSADFANQFATAADVTTLQVFRDLFSTEVFRPGEEISIGSTTLMFTDLRGSTKLYREIGDAQAFSRVREHFDILERAVAAEGGSIVKTMGDAIMAAFRTPADAMRAVWDVQKELTKRGQPLLMIKIGIHQGPCIAVNLNDRLDYFGSTVNIASRFPGFSTGGEAIFSQQIHDDPQVLAFLEKNAQPNSMVKFSGDIRGYDEPMDLWKVMMG